MLCWLAGRRAQAWRTQGGGLSLRQAGLVTPGPAVAAAGEPVVTVTHGSATVCGHITLEGWPLGIVTNNGPIDTAGANKATHFIQACGQSRRPILYLKHDGIHGGPRLRGGGPHQARREDDPGGDQRHGSANHNLLRGLVRGWQLRHVRTGFSPAILLFMAQRQDRGDGWRAGGAHHVHRHRGGCQAQRPGDTPGQCRGLGAAVRGQERVRRYHRHPGESDLRAAPHRDSGVRRPPRQRHPPG